MCGIAGIVNYPDREAIVRMTSVQAHRGPDDHGVQIFPEERIALGHRRLSIIDLTAGGHQPMSNDDGSIWLTFNGEIYNYLELRASLEKMGHRFKSRSDTEVLLRMYEQYGFDFVKQLNGMFALGLLDRRQNKLLLARDHFGIKPLYYLQQNGRFLFASEIKGLLAANVYTPEVNSQALYDYLTYLYVPCPETIFRGILQLPPAHILKLDLKTSKTELTRYWSVGSRVGNGNGKHDFEEASQKLRTLLTDATRRQMISDVPLGVFLSGGVDSPILTGLMAQASAKPVKTFTVVFEGKNVQLYNEQNEARAVAHKFGTEHYETSVDISEPLEMLSLIDHFDQPFGNPTFYLMYLISKAARSEVTVALSGAGGDELFAGYPRYRAMGLAKWVRWMPQPVLAGTNSALNIFSDDFRSPTLRRARQFVAGVDHDFAKEFVNWTYFLKDDQKRALLLSGSPNGGTLASERIVRKFLDESGLEEQGNRALQADIQTFLVDNILEYTDKMSMAVSLEVRVPFLDHRVVEHTLTTPFQYKLKSGSAKVMLKKAFSDLLPQSNARARKKGFNFPLAVWMRDNFDSYFEDQMNEQSVRRGGIFDWNYIQLLRDQHRNGKSDNSYPLFSLIMFDVWFKKYMN
uniref:asparagine synthase (glutamine-hydrolyzing) n=1 Tax=uncultured bacterium F39-01 TaxID=1191434 RepID=I3VIE4_9BACT|nr:asparagine synthase [uncultured bacterium F39-01]